MNRASHLYLFLVVAVVQLHSQNQVQPLTAPTLRTNPTENIATESFFDTKTSGSIILTGLCATGQDGRVVATDWVTMPDPARITRIDDDLDNLSQVNAHFIWSRSKDGLVQLRDDRASAEFLHLNLAQVRLTKIVNLEDAVNKLLKTPDVTRFLIKRHIELDQ